MSLAAAPVAVQRPAGGHSSRIHETDEVAAAGQTLLPAGSAPAPSPALSGNRRAAP